MHRSFLGISIMIFSLLVGMGFRVFVERPALQKLADGNYGEAFGYVSFFRVPFYLLCFGLFFSGVWICAHRVRMKDRPK